MTRTFRSILLAVPLFVATQAYAAPHQRSSQPSWVKLSLADRTFGDKNFEIGYDPASKYFLFYTGECDGAYLQITLTPEPHQLDSVPDENKKPRRGSDYKRIAIPRVYTGKGINIGDSPQVVARKLGQHPHRIENSEQDRTWYYYANISIPERRGPQNYQATYRFRDNKLWAIQYQMNAVEGS